MSRGSLIQTGCWIAVAFCAWFWPRFGESFFQVLERWLAVASRRPTRCCLALLALVLGLRAVLLPLWPVPVPAVQDEFSYLLMADTFAHGRLANPMHPLWQFFEATHVLSIPWYASKFFPGQGLFLAAGQVLTGVPWAGVWLSCGLMAAATLWAAFAWLPPSWALLAGAFSIPMSVTGYWMNSYWGGAVPALGGALAVGAAGRLAGAGGAPLRNAALLVTGSVLLCWTRPFEGLLLLIPLFVYLIWKAWGKAPVGVWLTIAAAGAAGAALLGYYDLRITGSPWIAPEAAFQHQYGSAPLFTFLEFSAPKTLPDAHMELVHNMWERDLILDARTPRGMAKRLGRVWQAAVDFTGGYWLFLFPAILFFDRLRKQPVGILLAFILAGAAGALVEMTYLSHYLAPFFAATVIVAAEGFRQLQAWEPGQAPYGRFLVRAILVLGVCFVSGRAGLNWIRQQDDSADLVYRRLRTEKRPLLEQSLPPGKHVVLVRYEPPYDFHAQWVYNRADIDSSDIIWAHDLGRLENLKILQYYPDRTFWLFQPNQDPELVEKYR